MRTTSRASPRGVGNPCASPSPLAADSSLDATRGSHRGIPRRGTMPLECSSEHRSPRRRRSRSRSRRRAYAPATTSPGAKRSSEGIPPGKPPRDPPAASADLPGRTARLAPTATRRARPRLSPSPRPPRLGSARLKLIEREGEPPRRNPSCGDARGRSPTARGTGGKRMRSGRGNARRRRRRRPMRRREPRAEADRPNRSPRPPRLRLSLAR